MPAYTNDLLRYKLDRDGDGAYRDVAVDQIVDPAIRALWTAVATLLAPLDTKIAQIWTLLLAPDVRPNSADDWASNTRLRNKITWEGGLFYTLVWYGVDPAEIHDPAVAQVWAAANDLADAYRMADVAVQAALRSSASQEE